MANTQSPLIVDTHNHTPHASRTRTVGHVQIVSRRSRAANISRMFCTHSHSAIGLMCVCTCKRMGLTPLAHAGTHFTHSYPTHPNRRRVPNTEEMCGGGLAFFRICLSAAAADEMSGQNTASGLTAKRPARAGTCAQQHDADTANCAPNTTQRSWRTLRTQNNTSASNV